MMDNKKIYNNLVVSSSPHMVSATDTTRIMLLVIVALIPSLCASVYIFGARVLLLAAVCVIASVAFEWLWNAILKKQQTVGDLSAALTGLLISFNVPSGIPLWVPIVGCFVAIVVVKQLYGGIGKNVVNPAITARIVLLISFATEMTTWPLPRMAADGASSATPLGILHGTQGAIAPGSIPDNVSMFLGHVGGSMGEVSAFALIIGGLFLIWKKVISPIIPLCFIGTVFAFAAIYYGATGYGDPLQMGIYHIFGGGLMLGAFFMATDYVTSPMLPVGKVIFGIGCGLITMLIRLFGQYPEGVSFAILLMNVLTPHIDNFSQKLMYGGAKKNEK